MSIINYDNPTETQPLNYEDKIGFEDDPSLSGYEQWVYDMDIDDRADFALEFIQSTRVAYGELKRLDSSCGSQHATIYYDAEGAFDDWLYEYYVNQILPYLGEDQ